MATLQQAAPPAAGAQAASSGLLLPLLSELEQASPSFLEPAAFFVSWQGVLTLAYRGFTQTLVDLKQRIAAAHPTLPPENPGSRWPKTSLGCLKDGCRLTPEQLQLLCRVCEEHNAAFQPQPQLYQRQQRGQQAVGGAAAAAARTAAPILPLPVDCAVVVLYECRSLERILSCQHVSFRGPLDKAPACGEEQARVAAILAEPQSPGYWFAASRDGNRESHYRGAHLGATLAHPLLPQEWVKGWAWDARNVPVEGLVTAGGVMERIDRRELLASVARFRAAVDIALPGMYVWFSDASLHVTLRALIN